MTYRVFINPDNGDSAVEDYPTFDKAAQRAVAIIRCYDRDWKAVDILPRLKAGATLSYHDYSEIRIEAVQ